MRIAICDDDAIDRAHLQALVEAYPNGRDCLDLYESASALVSAYDNGTRHDLVLLDIEMDGLNGYSAAELLRENFRGEVPRIVFVTITDKYVFTGYDVGAFGYLPKPVDPKKLYAKLDQANEELLFSTIHLHTQSGDRIVNISDILHVTSENNVLRFCTTSEDFSVRMTLEEFMTKLPSVGFAQTHRSHVVNLAHISRYDARRVYFPNSMVALSRQQRKAFELALDKYLRR